MKEYHIEKYLHDQMTKIGGTTRKWISPGHAGVPDRICFYNGKVFFVELKSPKGGLSKIQKREIANLIDHGVTIHVINTFHGVDNLILDLFKQC